MVDGSTAASVREWGGELAHVLPRLKTLGALVEVFPGLGKYAGQDSGGESHLGGAPAFGEDRLGRTESEEKEYEYQKSADMMRQEKKENAVLLETLKLVQGLDPGTLYDNEISLLRESIQHKQDMINELHSKGLEMSQKTKYLEHELHDQQDRTKEERERLLLEAGVIENSIIEIQEDRQFAVQRLQQYKLLYSRTKEDRDAAETRMLQARELVDSSKSDLYALKECMQNTIKVSQDEREKKLNSALADLEASKAFWKSSLEKKTREIDAIIRRYALAKTERTQEEERESQERVEAERIRMEMYQEHEKNTKALENDVRRARHVQREQWGLVCAAAGLEPDATATAVIQAYDALVSLENDLREKLLIQKEEINSDRVVCEEDMHAMENVYDENDCETEGPEELLSTLEKRNQDDIRKDAVISRIEMSLAYLQEKLAAFFEDSPSSLSSTVQDSQEPLGAAERLPKLRRRSSMLALHPQRLSATGLEHHILQHNKGKRDSQVVAFNDMVHSSSLVTLDSMLKPQIDEEKLCGFISRLASKETSEDCSTVDVHPKANTFDCSAEFSMEQLACCVSQQQRGDSNKVELCTADLMGVYGETKSVREDSITTLKAPDVGLHKPVLSREDVKARSLKIKAKLDRHRHYVSA